MDQLQQEGFAAAHLCRVLRVSRSAYYAWRKDQPSARALADYQLKPMIRSIFQEHKRRYGARRIMHELAARGERCSRRRVRRLMDEMNLVAIQPKSFKPRTTDSRHTLGYSDNLLLDARAPVRTNQWWVGDITYVPLNGGSFLYLAVLMDHYSRRIVGWDLQQHMKESLVLAALRIAIGQRAPRAGLIHHSDRGGQYAGHQYRQALARGGVQQSMSRADNCYDNALMESCFGTIKTELQMRSYDNQQIARKEIADYIRYDNTRRRHSALKYQTPETFEAAQTR